MKTSREEILNTALSMFAARGYDAVSTSDIAAELGITKGALYRHFENKQQIFDSIIEKMFALDASRATEEQVPVKTIEDDPEDYKHRRLEDLCSFTNGQLIFWTEDPFACAFRKMITIEQYKSEESQKLYQDVICMGPVKYTADLLQEMLQEGSLNSEAAQAGTYFLAAQLFAPLKLAIELCDGGADPVLTADVLQHATQEFIRKWGKKRE